MLQSALLLLALAVQQPTQQPAAAPKQHANATQQADTAKAKHRARHARKAKPAATTAPRDTTKSKP
ncbi:MAG TPA: hypothetical protein VGJ80_06025 [Gemmatimonadales bacterium]|jgi:hypothetical protein